MVSGIVVAGGQSRRLGQDKRRLRLWGTAGPTLLEHTLHILSPLCDDLVVVLNDPQNWPGLPARMVSDLYSDGGTLGGLYTGLVAAVCPYALVVAADMPLLNPPLLRAMLERPRMYDVLIPRSPRTGSTRNDWNVEPLHAIYHRACLPTLHLLLEQGTRRITDFLDQVHVTIMEADEIAAYDPYGSSFRNINTPEELELVLRELSG